MGRGAHRLAGRVGGCVNDSNVSFTYMNAWNVEKAERAVSLSRKSGWREVWFLSGIVICLLVAALGICLAIMARNAERNLELTVDDLTGTFRDNLELKGQLSLLDEVYLKLLDRYKNIGLLDPADDEHDRHLAILYSLAASIHQRSGNLKAARADLEKCETIRKHLCDMRPKDPNCKSELATVFDSLSDLDMQEGQPANARDRLYKSAEHRYELQKDSNDPDRLVAYAATQMRLSNVLRRLGQTEQADKEFQKALDLLKQHEADVDTKFARTLGIAWLNKGDESRNDGDVASALNSYRDSCTTWEDLLRRDPTNFSYKVNYAVALACLGDAQREMGDKDPAERSYSRSCDIRKKLFEDNDQDVLRAAEYAVSLTTLGDVYQSRGDWKTSWDKYDSALQIRKGLSAKAPEDLDLQADLAVNYTDEGDLLLIQGDVDKALDHYKDALKFRQTLAEADHNNLWRHDGVASCHLNLGDAYMSKQSYQEAESHYATSVTLRSRLHKDDPKNPARAINLAISNAKLAIAEMAICKDGLADKAEADWNDALPTLLGRLNIDGKNVTFAESVAGYCVKFGQESLKHDRKSTAQQAFATAEKLLTERDEEGRLDYYGSQWLKQLGGQKQLSIAAKTEG